MLNPDKIVLNSFTSNIKKGNIILIGYIEYQYDSEALFLQDASYILLVYFPKLYIYLDFMYFIIWPYESFLVKF